MPLRVFISHASEDTAFAERLAADLRRAGADVALDASHLGPGDVIARISQTMAGRDVLLLVLSPAALRSGSVPAEVNTAILHASQGFMHPPVFVLAQPVPPSDLPPPWANYPRIDATAEYTATFPDIWGALTLPTTPTPAPPAAPSAVPSPSPAPQPATAPPPPPMPPQPQPGPQLLWTTPAPQRAAPVPPPIQRLSQPEWAPPAPTTAPKLSRRAVLATTGSGVAALAVIGLAWLLVSHQPSLANAPHSNTPSAPSSNTPIDYNCATNEQTGLSGTPAAAGGPPAVSGQLVTLDQCLQYIDVTLGTGATVKAGDSVTVNYTGWLTDGTNFDSSLDPGRTPFQVQNVGQAQVIQGWNLGLIGMKVGGERRLIIPAALAYGSQGAGPIPPNATLIFDVTVVSIP